MRASCKSRALVVDGWTIEQLANWVLNAECQDALEHWCATWQLDDQHVAVILHYFSLFFIFECVCVCVSGFWQQFLVEKLARAKLHCCLSPSLSLACSNLSLFLCCLQLCFSFSVCLGVPGICCCLIARKRQRKTKKNRISRADWFDLPLQFHAVLLQSGCNCPSNSSSTGTGIGTSISSSQSRSTNFQNTNFKRRTTMPAAAATATFPKTAQQEKKGCQKSHLVTN